jgi:AcrR family transcriptional regulator
MRDRPRPAPAPTAPAHRTGRSKAGAQEAGRPEADAPAAGRPLSGSQAADARTPAQASGTATSGTATSGSAPSGTHPAAEDPAAKDLSGTGLPGTHLPGERRAGAGAVPMRERCLAEALAIIAEAGVEKLSLREVARRLGVSHQAPYKHFASRDDLLAELIARAFAEFADVLEDRPGTQDAAPAADLAEMGRLYMDYAVRHPLKYRLMFATPLPAPEAHPAMMANARRAFGLLCGRLSTMPRRSLPAAGGKPVEMKPVAMKTGAMKPGAIKTGKTRSVEMGAAEMGSGGADTADGKPGAVGLPACADLDALFVWSTLHGLATILPSDTYATLSLSEAERQRAVVHCFARLSLALEP